MAYSPRGIDIMSGILFANNNYLDANGLSFSSNNTSAYKADLAENSRSGYWEPDGTSTEEWIKIDLQNNAQPVTFFALIGAFNSPFNLQRNAVATLQANNIDNWDSPPLAETLSIGDLGIFHVLTSTDTYYRYWRIKMVDTITSFDVDGGANHARFHHMYLGDYIEASGKNVVNGFNLSQFSKSEILESDTGRRFSNIRKTYSIFDGMSMDLIPAALRRTLQQFANDVESHTPFYCSLDSGADVSSDISEMTRFCYFQSTPIFSHVFRDYFSMNFSLREVV